MESKIVESKVYPLKELFLDKFDVDFYQREYVWQRKQIEDLIMDLSTEFLKNWSAGDPLERVSQYDPYYMGEIVLSLKNGQRSAIIDGQQRITTLTLLLIYLSRTYGTLPGFPKSFDDLIYSDYYGTPMFNLDIEERKACMLSLFNTGTYTVQSTDPISVRNLVDRYNDIHECWNVAIDAQNVVSFAYWLKEKVVFSKVWTNSDEFAYVIFETMNDRGLSLTQVEMLRSYLLANIAEDKRRAALKKYDTVIQRLVNIKISSGSKAEFEFFKIYLRGHFALDLSQSKNTSSDFVRIGKEFHRWVRDNEHMLGLHQSSDFEAFIDKIDYFSKVYKIIYDLTQARNTREYLYLIVNHDYGFTLQPALLLASICYNDTEATIYEKIKIVSKYLTKVLSWRVWNHWMISQSSMESTIYELCKQIRGMSADELKAFFDDEPIKDLPELSNAPILNQQNRSKLRVLISLITEIVARESGEPDYMLNKPDIQVEHIWSDHPEQHLSDCTEMEFPGIRNGIGDLLVLPKSFNASYGDLPYEDKIVQYFSQNILAQTLCRQKYANNPGFVRFITRSSLPFEAYDSFTKGEIAKRAELYKAILLWNWSAEQSE